MWPTAWNNVLGPWQWAALAAIPPILIALYFLKLRREPVEVPSTYLWLHSIEDLHVNSLWQRIRRSLLLALQLLLIALLAFALLGPSWQGSRLEGNRFVFLIDNSASMAATDVTASRLAEAKRQALELVDEMRSGDVAMVISFAETARVEQSFTDNRSELRARIEQIQPTKQGTSLVEGLALADALAKAGHASSGTTEADTPAAEPLATTLLIFSDGNFPAVPDVSLGQLQPAAPVWIGDAKARNVAITALSAARSEAASDAVQAFARVQNFGAESATVTVEWLLDGQSIDAEQIDLPPGESRRVVRDLGELEQGVVELVISQDDDLASDNRAAAVVSKPRPARVLLVTPGNEPLELALRTPAAAEMASIQFRSPDYLESSEYRQAVAGREFDLVIYDRCQPADMPQANTLWIGRLPPGDRWGWNEKVELPQIVDVDRVHPLMQWVETADTYVLEARPLRPPQGSTVLIDSDHGPLLAIGPRDAFEDAVLGFELMGDDRLTSTWPVRSGFPVFMLNVLSYLGGHHSREAAASFRPGDVVPVRAPRGPQELSIRAPDGSQTAVRRDSRNEYPVANTTQTGVYEVLDSGNLVDRFAVNLLDPAESDIRTRPDRPLEVGTAQIESRSSWQGAPRAAWKYVVLAALVVLAVEWYIYNRRTYL